jgi:hypothetical protein
MDNTPTSNQRDLLLGRLAFLTGALALLAVAMIAFTSFTAFDPPNWLRILIMLPLPLEVILSLGFGWVSLKTSGRGWAIAGLALAALAILAFIVILVVGG